MDNPKECPFIVGRKYRARNSKQYPYDFTFVGSTPSLAVFWVASPRNITSRGLDGTTTTGEESLDILPTPIPEPVVRWLGLAYHPETKRILTINDGRLYHSEEAANSGPLYGNWIRLPSQRIEVRLD